MTPIWLLPILIASGYVLVVTVCVVGRMDKKTRLKIRLPIICLAFFAFLSITRTIWGDWQFSLGDISLAVSVIVGAIMLAFYPRIQV